MTSGKDIFINKSSVVQPNVLDDIFNSKTSMTDNNINIFQKDLDRNQNIFAFNQSSMNKVYDPKNIFGKFTSDENEKIENSDVDMEMGMGENNMNINIENGNVNIFQNKKINVNSGIQQKPKNFEENFRNLYNIISIFD